MQTVTTVTVGYTVLIHLQLFYIFPVLVIVPALIVGVIVHFWIQSNKANEKLRLAKLFPVSPLPNETANKKEAYSKSDGLSTVAVAIAAENDDADSDDASDSSSEPTYKDIDLESGPDSDHPEVDMQLHLPLGAALGVEPPKGHTTRRQSVQHGLRVLESLQRAQEPNVSVSAQLASKNGDAHRNSASDDSDSESSVCTADDPEQEYGEVVTVSSNVQHAQTDPDQVNRVNSGSSSSQSAPDGVARRPFSAMSRLSEQPRSHFMLSSSSSEEEEKEEEGSDYSAKSEGQSHRAQHARSPHPHQRAETAARDPQIVKNSKIKTSPQGRSPFNSQPAHAHASSQPASLSERSSEIRRCRSISLSEPENSASEEEDPHDRPFASDRSESDSGNEISHPVSTTANNSNGRNGWWSRPFGAMSYK